MSNLLEYSLLWVPFTIMAAFMQSWRNALQKQLRQYISTLGVTLARFIVALPLAGLYLSILYRYYPDAIIPPFSFKFLANIIIAAVTQIAATAFMVQLFKTRNYAIGVGLAKSEAVIAAILGAWFFSAPLSPVAWLGVCIGGIAVWLMSLAKTDNTGKENGQLSTQTIVYGISSGLFFAFCTLFIREAALILRNELHQNFLLSASWVLFFVLLIQTVLLIFWLAIREPKTLVGLYQHKRLTTGVSIFSLVGSIGWFTAMSLQTVAMVKTLGQIEVLFTLMISVFWFKETLVSSDRYGLALIVVGAVLVIFA